MEKPVDSLRPVRIWLWTVVVAIGVMVLIGGTTRLTGSGLSMTTWHPLMGAVPPLNDADWDHVFGLYKNTPQYAQVNQWMQLSDFKRIFFWEYLHRLMGRLLGIVFVVPWIYFVLRGRLVGRDRWWTFLAFALGGLQGLLGWIMVKSGLVDLPRVSHYRLAAHLILAFLTAQYVLWLAVRLGNRRRLERRFPSSPTWLCVFAGLLLLQILYGALVAGLRAGETAMTFPDMNGAYFSSDLFPKELGLRAAVEDPLTVHFLHRVIALLIVLIGGIVAWKWRRATWYPKRWSVYLTAAMLVQVALGATTVLTGISIVPAVAHQVNALILLLVFTYGNAVASTVSSRGSSSTERLA
jgi:cytochrome c oxidase assembly protein subunit 15